MLKRGLDDEKAGAPEIEGELLDVFGTNARARRSSVA